MKGEGISRRSFLKAASSAAILGSGAAGAEELLASDKLPQNEGEKEIIPSACRQCYGRCAIYGTVKNGRLVKIEGNPELYNEGTVCSRAFSIPQTMYSPMRIRYPMKRVGKRGEGKWKRISWEEAMTEIAGNLKKVKDKYGPHTIIHNNGTGRDQLNIYALQYVFWNYGSTSCFGVGNLCKIGHDAVSREIYGGACQWSGWDGQKTKCIIMWGRQIKAFGYYDWLTVKRAKERGVKLIVVDPRFNSTSCKADVWLPVRPGSDMALALAFINVMIRTKRYDAEFIRKWTNGPFLVKEDGFLLRESDLKKGGSEKKMAAADEKTGRLIFWDGETLSWSEENAVPAIRGKHKINGKTYPTSFEILAESVSEWTVEKAAELTWVPKDRIETAINLYLDNSPGASFCRGQKTEFTPNTSGLSHAFNLLMALSGNFEAEGGQNCIRETPHASPVAFVMYPPKSAAWEYSLKNPDKTSVSPGTQKISGEFGGWGAAVTNAMVTGKPFQPRAYFGAHCDPILGLEDSKKVLEGMLKMDFIANVNLFMSPACEISDIVLPASHPNEVDRIEYPQTGHPFPATQTILIRQPFGKPAGECRDDIDILFDLGRRLGVDMHWKDTKDFYDWSLKKAGTDFEGFRKKVYITAPIHYKKHETGRLRKDKKPGFPTPDGKFNLYSEALKKYGWGPVPKYVEVPNSPYSEPELYKKYPLIFISGARSDQYFHSEYRQSPYMRELHSFPRVQVNPETAAKYGIKDGEWIYIESSHGKCTQMAEVTAAVHPGVIHMDHDWWFPEKEASDELHGCFVCNPNVLVSNEQIHDPAIGTSSFGGLCRIYPSKDGAPAGIYTEPEQMKAMLPVKDGGK